MRKHLSLTLLATILAVGCVGRDRPAYRPPVVIPAPAEATPEALRWAVEAGLAERHWTVHDQKPGVIHAYVQSEGSGEFASIEVTYRTGAVEVRQIGGNVDPYRYDRWSRFLSSDIRKYVAQIGMGRAIVIPASPPPAAPPASEP